MRACQRHQSGDIVRTAVQISVIFFNYTNKKKGKIMCRFAVASLLWQRAKLTLSSAWHHSDRRRRGIDIETRSRNSRLLARRGDPASVDASVFLEWRNGVARSEGVRAAEERVKESARGENSQRFAVRESYGERARCPCGLLRALHKHNETRLSVDLSDLRVG